MSRHQREGTVFYKSFYDAIKNLPDKERLEVLDAIFLYDFDNKNTKLFGISATIFTLIKPQLDANKKRYLSGKKGGRPPKTAGDKALQDNQNITKTKPNNNQNITKTKPNININNNMNINKNNKETKQILEVFNKVTGKDLKSSLSWEKNFKRWRLEYSLEEIIKAIENMKYHKWFIENQTAQKPDVFFKTNKDWISDCLQVRKKKKENYFIPDDI